MWIRLWKLEHRRTDHGKSLCEANLAQLRKHRNVGHGRCIPTLVWALRLPNWKCDSDIQWLTKSEWKTVAIRWSKRPPHYQLQLHWVIGPSTGHWNVIMALGGHAECMANRTTNSSGWLPPQWAWSSVSVLLELKNFQKITWGSFGFSAFKCSDVAVPFGSNW